MPRIEKFMELSTAHISRDTNKDMLESARSNMIMGMNHWTNEICFDDLEFGWLFYITPIISPKIPAELFYLLKMAQDAGCSLLRLDQAETVDPELPTFDW